MKRSLWLYLTIILLAAPDLQGVESRPFFRGVRAQGMGGASIAVVNDETALFLNPAGIGKIRGTYLVVANPELETNGNTYNLLSNGEALSGLMSNGQGLLDTLQSNPDKPLHLKFQVLPALVATNFAAGVYVNYLWDLEYDSVNNEYDYFYRSDIGAAIGYNLRLFDGRVKLGVSGRFINRALIDVTVLGTETNFNAEDVVQEGGGVGVDLGLMLTGPWVWLPTVTAVVRDFGNTYFQMTEGYFHRASERPPEVKQTIDAAIGLFPIHSKNTRSSFTVEYRDVANANNESSTRKLHVGYELNLGDILFLRGGWNQQYWTAGLEFAVGFQQLQFATYGEEIGTDTQSREDRRYVVQYGLRF